MSAEAGEEGNLSAKLAHGALLTHRTGCCGYSVCMERAKSLSVLIAAVISISGCASSPPRDAGAKLSHPQPLAREAVEVIKAQALAVREVDWDAELRRIESAAPPMAPGEAVRAVLAAYGDPHAAYQSAEEAQAWRNGAGTRPSATGEGAQQAGNDAAAEKPQVPDGPWGNLLDERTGYIGLPPCGTGDRRQMTLYAWTIRGLIASQSAAGATSWVIDLRLNGGGNIWPMLVGLAPLLGDGPQFRSLMPRGAAQVFGLSGDAGWMDVGAGPVLNFELINAERPARDVRGDRVATLIGPWTMSSGEMMAVALISCGQTRTFGESTAGLTTITGFFPLSDGSVLVLPTGRVATAAGRVFDGRIEPDTPVEIGEWPRQDDDVVRAAQEWLGR